MLTQATKRKIDTARDILVGKVPDPKAQVEQITTALIYKFMDDMDKEAVELGGKPRFFTKDYEKYSWTKLLDSKIGGQERLNLYLDAITSFSQNPHLPQLFRDIFKDAFLPYRDPETLNLFIKEINGFTYDHSEDLGDAFEYLLSVLGSQGEAGQFRTPRHIIDFIVGAVDPNKNDTVCDPACGTAGFLISAYKHILKQHDGLDDPEHKEKPLTPDERKQLMNHFSGYDISPDMVRLSKVNMYLHGFPNPTIFEYDTLTSEEKWDESYDVMLANPPFMTPKGGIKPHKRFSVQANRSEVLFVDYMLEHLRPGGRAGIIVPEGIIFQNGSAYKILRKLLVEDGLFAIASLPPGVFNPYSGVRTSILFFDKSLAKKTNSLLFIKIQNDGYDLGAQRKEINKSDLPLANEVIERYRVAIKGEKSFQLTDKERDLANLVLKEKVARSGDYSLVGDRYKEDQIIINQKWPIVRLGDVIEVLDSRRKPVTKSDRKGGVYPYYGATGILDYVDGYLFDEKLVLIGEDGAKWGKGEKTAFIANGKYWVNNHAHVLRTCKDKIIDEYLVPLLNSMDLTPYTTGITVPKLNQEKLKSINIPLPPIEIQNKISKQIDSKQQIIESAKNVIQNLERERRNFGDLLIKAEDIKWEYLESLADLEYGFTETAKSEGDTRFIRITDIGDNGKLKDDSPMYINMTNKAEKYLLKKDDLLVARTGATYGKTVIIKDSYRAIFASYLIRINIDKSKVLPYFYWLFTQSTEYWRQAQNLMTGGGQQQFNANAIKRIKVPLIPIETQNQLLLETEEQEKIIDANLRLINTMKQKIDKILEEI